MFSSWRCRQCGLYNKENRNACQACFHRPTKQSPFQRIMRDQHLLHSGYLRQDVLGVDPEETNIPKDIIELSLQFFRLDVRVMYNEIGTRFANDRGILPDDSWWQVRNAYSLAEEFAKHSEHFMAHQILDTLIAYKPGFGNLHFAVNHITNSPNP